MTAEQRLTVVKNKLTLYRSDINTSLVAKGASAVSDIGEVSGAIDTISTGVTPTGTISISQNGNYDVTDYASASVDVPDYWQYVTTLQFAFSEATQVPDKIELNLPNLETFTYGPAHNCQPKEYIIHLSETGKCTSMVGACQWGKSLIGNDNRRQLTLVKITGDLSNVTSYQNCFNGIFNNDGNRQPNATIDADLDFTSASNVSNMFSNCWDIVNMRFVENTLKISLSISSGRSFSDSSLISIINGLNETATGQTLTLHATAKTKLSTMMGTVALDETETYHIFTADPNGNTSLLDFATQIKGWTIA